jgi:hypothetical protein
MRIKRLVTLASLWFIGATPASVMACGDSNDPSCLRERELCGNPFASCCPGLNCIDTETGSRCLQQ